MKILIGYDGSVCAAEAIDELSCAGLGGSDVQAIVMTIADVWAAAPAEDYARQYPEMAQRIVARVEAAVAEARSVSDQGRQRVAALFPAWQTASEAAPDSPYWGLVKRAQEWEADLLVLGSHGRSLVGRAVFGSVSQHAVLYARCSVRIGRCRPDKVARADAPVRIVIGWDGSAGAMLAVSAVAQRRWPAGSEARLITAMDGRLSTALPTAELAVASAEIAEMRNGADAGVQAAANQLRAGGLDVAEHLKITGDPKRVLVDEARTWGADSIFVGAKGLSRIERVLLGSVSAAVSARAECSVEIVRG